SHSGVSLSDGCCRCVPSVAPADAAEIGASLQQGVVVSQRRRTRFVRRNPRILIALVLAIAITLLLPRNWPFVTRLLTGWNGGVILFLVSIYLWMRSLTAQQICSRYIEEDPSAPIILVCVTAAALLSLIATVDVLASIRQLPHQERTWYF